MKRIIILISTVLLVLLFTAGCSKTVIYVEDSGDKSDSIEKPMDNAPFIEFKSDDSCRVDFGVEDKDISGSCDYEISKTSDGKRLIKVDVSDIAKNNKDIKLADFFYLGEQNDGSWKYFGSSLGEIKYGDVCVPEGEKKIKEKIYNILPDVKITPAEYLDGDGKMTIFTPEDSDELIISIDHFEYAEIDSVYGNIVFFKEKFLIPRWIEKERFESEILSPLPEGRQKEQLKACFCFYSLNDPFWSNAGKERLLLNYPILEKSDIYCFATDLNYSGCVRNEEQIKNDCQYSYEDMEYDYSLVGYKRVCGVLEFSYGDEVTMNYFDNERYEAEFKEYVYK